MAEWESGEINIDEKEILTANWFAKNDVPQLPASLSISRKLIDIFLN